MSATANFPATLPPTIPIAGFKDVYDVAAVENAMLQLTSSASEALKSTYEKMLRLGGARLTVKPAGVPSMDALYRICRTSPKYSTI